MVPVRLVKVVFEELEEVLDLGCGLADELGVKLLADEVRSASANEDNAVQETNLEWLDVSWIEGLL